MKKYVIALCGAALVTAGAASAFELPGSDAKVDTKKIDELIASIQEVSGELEVARVKIDVCHATLAQTAEAHDAAGLLSDPAKLAELRDDLTDEEKAMLEAQAEIIQTVPDDLTAAEEKAKEIVDKIPGARADLAKQIKDNPAAAASLLDKDEKLKEGKAALEQIADDVPELVASATSLAAKVASLL
jgi:chromosome segregation ATPase